MDLTTSGSPAPLLSAYLARTAPLAINPAAAAIYAGLDHLGATAPSVAQAIVAELRDQRQSLKLIASENYSSLATQLAHANWFTDKYAEGYPGHRFYAGCANVDTIEAEAVRLACELFGAEHAYVQPHSGADANLVAFLAILSDRVQPGALAAEGIDDPVAATPEQWNRVRAALHNQRLLALDYYSGGHLTHGWRHNISARLFEVHSYGVDPQTRLIDYDALRRQAREVRPLILLAGYSAYPRKLNFARLREIADEVGAVLMVDMAHFAGLVAGKVFSGDYDPVPHAQIVTTTTHKTLRGPRGGMVLAKKELAEQVDKGCPLALGGPLPHVMAAKAVAFREALRPEFRDYAQRIVANAQALAEACQSEGITVASGGTDNHLLLLDVQASFGLNGRIAESALRECGLTLNRNALPFDSNGPWYTSGLRLGTPAVTTLGMGAAEMRQIARIVHQVLGATRPTTISKGERAGQLSRTSYKTDPTVASEARAAVAEIKAHFTLYPELDLDLLLSAAEAWSEPVAA